MTTVIIGAGMAGLSAGYHLKDDVVILEKSDTPGGLCSSYHVTDGGHDYYIEKFYHHSFEVNHELIRMCKELGLTLDWRAGTTGYAFDGKIYPLNTPLEILAYPRLSLVEKARLALFTLKCRSADPDKHANETATDFIIRNAGVSVYNKFFLPLLKGKFGDDFAEISGAWLITRIMLRSNRGARGEKLSYVSGGYHNLTDRLSGIIGEKGGKILFNTEVRDIVVEDGAVRGVVTDSGTIRADNVICTSPQLYLKYTNRNDIAFQKTVCTLFALRKKISDIYWVNISEDLSFKALIEHTNFVPFEAYGENLVYAVAYSHREVDVEGTVRAFRSDLGKFGITDADIIWERTFYQTATSAVYNRGYTPVPYEGSVKGLYFAGIFSPASYPARGVSMSLDAGKEAAALINKKLPGV